MKHAKFKALVSKSEKLFNGDPEGYRRSLTRFIMLGKLYYFALILIPLAITALIVWLSFEHGRIPGGIYIAISTVLLLINLVPGLFRKLPPPKGVSLTRDAAPELFDEVSALTRRTNAQEPDRILIDATFNAGVAHIPTRWLFSKPERFLMLGLPLMAGLSLDQFRAILAHEFGHLSLDRPKYLRVAVQTRMLWASLEVSIRQSRDIVQMIFVEPFIKWYLPRLDAKMAVLSRMNEFDADAASAKICGAMNAACALAMCGSPTLVRNVMEGAQRELWAKARVSPNPEPGFHMSLLERLKEGRSSLETLNSEFERLKGRKAMESDSHPSIGERIRRLGVERLETAEPDGEHDDAISLLPKEALESVATRLDMDWMAESLPIWTSVYDEAQFARMVMPEFKDMPWEGRSLEFKLKEAQLMDMAEGDDAAVEPLKRIIAEHPSCAMASYQLGRILLSRHNPEGVEHLKNAIRLDRKLMAEALNILNSHYETEGMEAERDADIDMWEREQSAFVKDVGKAARPSWRNTYSHHGLSERELDAIRNILSENPPIVKAYLVKRGFGSGGESNETHLMLVKEKALSFRISQQTTLVAELSRKILVLGGVQIMEWSACPILVRWKIRRTKDSLIFKH